VRRKEETKKERGSLTRRECPLPLLPGKKGPYPWLSEGERTTSALSGDRRSATSSRGVRF